MAEEKIIEQEVDIASIQAELAKLKDENEKLRKANTNASSDASKYKKALQEKMSEEEKAKAEREEHARLLQEELESLRKDKNISEHMAQFLSAGYSNELARSSATAMVEGNFGTVFSDLKSFIEAHDKDITAKNIMNTPKPGSGDPGKTITKEQFSKMTYAERVNLFNTQPELYGELTKK